jgi:hypothetical protein
MNCYSIRCDGATTRVEAEDMAEAKSAAVDWANESDGGLTTSWSDYYVVQIDYAGSPIGDPALVTVTFVPEAPRCLAGKAHDWQRPYDVVGGLRENPGVWGSGGGVVMDECCVNCGCARITDTWAHRPDTGEGGLESVTYVPGRYRAYLDDAATVATREVVS